MRQAIGALTTVSIPTDVILSGSSNDVWIFQITGNLNHSNGVTVPLKGGAHAKNVFWQVASLSMLGRTSNFEGILPVQDTNRREDSCSRERQVVLADRGYIADEQDHAAIVGLTTEDPAVVNNPPV